MKLIQDNDTKILQVLYFAHTWRTTSEMVSTFFFLLA